MTAVVHARRQGRGLALAALACALAIAITSGGVAEVRAASAASGIFGSSETRSDDLKPFPKWIEALDRYVKERSKVEGSCTETTLNKCHYQRWQDLVAGLAGKSRKSQLDAVNRYANQAVYTLDPVNWGVKDYWASPGQFFVKNGDCEDYAITKFLTLRALGFTPSELRIVVLQDLDLRIAHAILAVYEKDKIFVLDNQMSMVVEDRRIRHYKPIFSVSEDGWWRHRAAKAKG